MTGRRELSTAIGAAAAEAARWDDPRLDLRTLAGPDLEAALHALSALRAELEPLVLQAEAVEPENLDLITQASFALRPAVYGEALARHVLHMRKPRATEDTFFPKRRP